MEKTSIPRNLLQRFSTELSRIIRFEHAFSNLHEKTILSLKKNKEVSGVDLVLHKKTMENWYRIRDKNAVKRAKLADLQKQVKTAMKTGFLPSSTTQKMEEITKNACRDYGSVSLRFRDEIQHLENAEERKTYSELYKRGKARLVKFVELQQAIKKAKRENQTNHQEPKKV